MLEGVIFPCKIEVFYCHTDEIVKVINTGGGLVSLLTGSTAGCPLIGSEIKIGTKIGKGSSGLVFNIKFRNGNSSQFVVKTVDIPGEYKKLRIILFP